MCLIVFIFIICLFLFYGIYGKWLDSIISSYILMSSIILAAAELLSTVKRYNVVGCFLFLLVFMFVFCFAFREGLQKGFSTASKSISIYWETDKIKVLFAVLTAILIIVSIVKVFVWPPQNGDSMTYHLPRSYMYWKNETIHNFPFSYKWGLYTGPFSAIVMSFLRIFSHGSDVFLGFSQLPGWIVASFAAGRAGQILAVSGILANRGNANRTCGSNQIAFLVPFVLMMTLPIAVFQSSSTQCDLMGGCFTCISVYYFLQVFLTKEKKSSCDILLGGLAVGLSCLTKVNNTIPIFFMSLGFAVWGIKKYKTKMLKIAVSIIAIVLLVNVGYWVRNAIDLNGDFLAISVSTKLGSSHMGSTAANLICNIGYLFGNGNQQWSKLVDATIGFAVRVFTGSTVEDNFSSFGEIRTFDFYPYGIHMVMSSFAIAYTIIRGIRKKNYILPFYALACVCSFILVAVSVNYTVSISRYMLGVVFITFPLVGCAAVDLVEKVAKDNRKTVRILTGGLIMCGCFLYATALRMSMTASHGDVWYGMNTDYNILRQEAYWHLWDEPEKAIMAQIYANGYTNIGIQEDVVIGEYPLLNDLKDYPCNIQYINTQWGSQYGDPAFYPDCIIYAGDEDAMPKYLEYQGNHFGRLGETYYVWPGRIGLYIGDSE